MLIINSDIFELKEIKNEAMAIMLCLGLCVRCWFLPIVACELKSKRTSGLNFKKTGPKEKPIKFGTVVFL